MSKKLCKGGCGNIATFKGWCKTKWISENKFAVACPRIESKRAKSISKFRLEEAKLGKNPMQNPKICKKNHSKIRNKRAALTLKKLGKLGLLPQQIESQKLKDKRRKNVSNSLKKLWLEGKHPRQLETEEDRKKRFKKTSETNKRLASQNKLFMQNLTEEQKKELGRKVSRTLRRKIRNGEIALSRPWKQVYYKNIMLRSNWERKTAKFLDKNKIIWKYESLRIPYFDSERNVEATTIPDFYLPEHNTIIEVKSNARFNSPQTKDKIKAISKLGYNTLLFGRKEIKSIEEDQEGLLGLIKNEKS